MFGDCQVTSLVEGAQGLNESEGTHSPPRAGWARCLRHSVAVEAGLQIPGFRAPCTSPLCCVCFHKPSVDDRSLAMSAI